jgi:hypothetical protein
MTTTMMTNMMTATTTTTTINMMTVPTTVMDGYDDEYGDNDDLHSAAATAIFCGRGRRIPGARGAGTTQESQHPLCGVAQAGGEGSHFDCCIFRIVGVIPVGLLVDSNLLETGRKACEGKNVKEGRKEGKREGRKECEGRKGEGKQGERTEGM